MCGILATFSPVEESVFCQALDLLKHRGPDYQNFVRFKDCFVGHTLLAINQNKEFGVQPIEDDSFVLIFNGEFYNLNEICSDYNLDINFFESDGQCFISLFKIIGTKVFSLLDGIFSIIIIDKINCKVILARDKFGVKPLYYHKDLLFFSSEISPIRYLFDQPFTFSTKTLLEYYSFGYALNDSTLWEEILTFPAESYLEINLEASSKSFSFIKFNTITNTNSITLKRFENVLKQQFNTSVKKGLLLSGGLDSSAIGCVASKFENNLKAYVVNQNGIKTNDVYYTNLLTIKLGLNLCEVKTEIESSLPKILSQLLEEPIPDIAAYYLSEICKKAHHENVKVLFSGIGADEIWGGYRRHVLAWYVEKYPNFFKFLYYFFSFFTKGKLINSFSGNFYQFFVFKNINQSVLKELNLDYDKKIVFEKLLDFDRRNYLKNNNLLYTDKVSMKFGIEIRVPYLSNNLFRNSNLKLIRNAKGKNPLYVLFKDILPKEIIQRSKKGFGGVPIKEVYDIWLNNIKINKENLRDIFQSKEELISYEDIDYRQLLCLNMILELSKWNKEYTRL